MFQVWFSNRRARLRKHTGANPSNALASYSSLPLSNISCQYPTAPDITNLPHHSSEAWHHQKSQFANYNHLVAHSQQLNHAFQNSFPGPSSGFSHLPPVTANGQLFDNGIPRNDFARCPSTGEPYNKNPSPYLPKTTSVEPLKLPTGEEDETRTESFPKAVIDDYSKMENFSKMAADYSKMATESNLNWNQSHVGFSGLSVPHPDSYSFPNITDVFTQQSYGHHTPPGANKYWS